MANEYVAEGVPFLRSQNVHPFRLHLDDVKFITPGFHAKLKKCALRPGDVVVVRTGYPGTAAVVPESLPVSNCADLVVISPRADALDPHYLVAIFNSTWGRATVSGNLVGAAQQHFNIGAARNMEVSLPSLGEQRRIAGILSAYDDLIENCERRIRVLDEMARSLYREWFVDFRFPGALQFVELRAGAIPEGWSRSTVGAMASFLSRGIAPTYDDDGALTVINQKCIRDGRLNMDSSRKQKKPIPELRQLQVGDVLINSTGEGTLGRVAQVLAPLPNCTVDTHVTIVRPGPDVDLWFFGCALLGMQERLGRMGLGATGQTELNRSAIDAIALLRPPLSLQQVFASRVKPIRLLSQMLQERIANLRATRDLLLPRLLSGQLSVDDAA